MPAHTCAPSIDATVEHSASPHPNSRTVLSFHVQGVPAMLPLLLSLLLPPLPALTLLLHWEIESGSTCEPFS